MEISRTIIVLDAADLDEVSSFWARLLGGTVEPEEDWHTVARPTETGVKNVVVCDALVSHLTFLTQKRFFADGRILKEYQIRAERLT